MERVFRPGAEDIPNAFANLEADLLRDLWPAFPETNDVPTIVGGIPDGAKAPGRTKEGAEFASEIDRLFTELSWCKGLGRGGATAETLGMVMFKEGTSLSKTTTDDAA